MSYLCGANLRINDMTFELFTFCVVAFAIGVVWACLELLLKKIGYLKEQLRSLEMKINSIEFSQDKAMDYLLEIKEGVQHTENAPSENISKK